MPQISLEYTANLGREDPGALLAEVHRILAEAGGVTLEACKSRARCLDSFVMGDGADRSGFVHLRVQIFPKTAAWKTEIGALLLHALKDAYPHRGRAPLTVHIDDSVQASAYFKDPPMKHVARASNRQKVADAFALKAQTGTNQAWLDLCAEDLHWTLAGSGALCRTYTSKADFVHNCLGALGQRLDGPIQAQVETILADGDTVAVLWKGEGRTTWGAPYNNDYCWVFEFDEGLIRRAVAYIDTLLLDRVMTHAP